MTGKELFRHMLTLGGKTEWLDEIEGAAKYQAANLALREINVLFPLTKKIRLLHYPLRPIAFYKGITVHRGGEDIEFNASGVKSLAFAVSGTGNVQLHKIEYDDDKKEVITPLTLYYDDSEYGDLYSGSWEDTNDFRVIRWINLEGETINVRLTFAGQYSYMIKDLSFYDEVTSDSFCDVVPFSPWIEYDMSSQKHANGDFLEFATSPVMIDGDEPRELREYKIEGSCIYLPSSISGTVEITYKRDPRAVNADNVADKLDIDPELCELVPFLAAYYMYYLSDPEAADRCYSEYQRRMGVVVAKLRKVRTPRKLKDLRGW